MLEAVSGIWAAVKSHVMIAVTVVALVTVGTILWRDAGLVEQNKALTSSLNTATEANAAQKDVIDTYVKLRQQEAVIIRALGENVQKIQTDLQGQRTELRRLADNDADVRTYLAGKLPAALLGLFRSGSAGQPAGSHQ